MLAVASASLSKVSQPDIVDNMIPRSRKFPMRTGFLTFRAKAKRLSSPHLTAYYTKSRGPSRLAVTIPKKVNKLAATRNWLKRLTFDSLWPRIKDSSHDVVIVYKPLPTTKSPETKKQILSELASLQI